MDWGSFLGSRKKSNNSSGARGTLKLSAVLERQPGGNSDARTHMTEEGVDLIW
jgi:hypothetical protein